MQKQLSKDDELMDFIDRVSFCNGKELNFVSNSEIKSHELEDLPQEEQDFEE